MSSPNPSGQLGRCELSSGERHCSRGTHNSSLDRGIATACVLLAAACSDATAPPSVQLRSDISVLALATFDGSGQAVHPDAALTPLGWDGSDSQLFVTPYPNGDVTKENPSLYARSSMFEWLVPRGVTNPVISPVAGYLSDPDEVFNPDSAELWLYYRAVTDENRIYLMKGRGPNQWSPPALVANGPNHTIVSPTVVRRAPGDWMMWSVNSGPGGCTSNSTTVELRHSGDGVNWSAPIPTDLTDEQGFAWHIDVEWIPSKQEFWSLYNVKVSGSCTTAALHFARSVDGLRWTVAPGPVLIRGQVAEFSDIVYRASFLYDDSSNSIALWYSGARFDAGRYTWRIAVERLSVADFLTLISRGTSPSSGALPAQPQLTNETAP